MSWREVHQPVRGTPNGEQIDERHTLLLKQLDDAERQLVERHKGNRGSDLPRSAA